MLRGRGYARGGIVLSCVALVLVTASVASAAVFDWAPTGATSPNGAFEYEIGRNFGDTSVSDLLGTPTILDSGSTAGFDFDNIQNFQAVGGGGTAGLANTVASTRVISQGNTQGNINSIFINETGTWSAPGGEAPADIFTFTLILGLQPIFPFGGPSSQFSNLSSSIVFNQDGTWTAQGVLIPLTGAGSFFTVGGITAENILVVEPTATPGSTFTKLSSTILIPEPTTVALLLAGLGPLALRRRRNN